MPTQPNRNILVVHSESGIRVSEVRAFLAAIENAYNGALLFQRTLDAVPRWERQVRGPFRDAPPVWGLWPLLPVAGKRNQPHALTRSSIASFVGRSQSLVLQSVRLQSPGEWKFIGLPDPLEVIRKYLNDRHERRKDKNYREAKEEQRMTLENDVLRTEALERRVRLAKELGATEEDLAPLKELLLYQPLNELDRFQDNDLITDVSVVELADQAEEDRGEE